MLSGHLQLSSGQLLNYTVGSSRAPILSDDIDDFYFLLYSVYIVFFVSVSELAHIFS